MKWMLLFFLFVVEAQAGVRDVGNGGEVVVCRNARHEITKIELLDVFEARIFRGKNVNVTGSTMEEKLASLFERIAKRNPTRAKRYAGWAKFLLENAVWAEGPLEATHDVDPSIIPPDCGIEQIAIQADFIYGDKGPKLTLDVNLWNALDSSNQAILLLHEVIYHEYLRGYYNPYEAKSAVPIRYLASLIFSGDLEEISTKDYVVALRLIRAKDYDFMGVNVRLPDSRDLQRDDWDKKGQVFDEEWFRSQPFQIQGKTIELNYNAEISLHPNYKVQSIQGMKDPTKFLTPYGEILFRERVEFDEGGTAIGGYLAESREFPVDENWTVLCDQGFKLRDGKLTECVLNQNRKLVGSGYDLQYLSASIVQFNQGRIWFLGYRDLPISGTLPINGTPTQFKYMNSEYSTGISITIERNTYKVRDQNVTTSGKISFHPVDETLRRFNPEEDFEYSANGIRVTVAAQTRCGFLWLKSVQNEVELTRNGDLYKFVNAKSFTTPKGKRIPSGSIVYVYGDDFQVWGNVCGRY